MALDQPILLKRIPSPPWGDFTDRKTVDYDAFVKTGGYQMLDKALAMTPEAVVTEVKAAELRGRGGAGFPAGMKWSFLPPVDDGQRFLAINADESEPATFKDQILIQFDPHQVIEGIAICMHACQLDTAYFFIRGEYHHHREIFEAAIQEAYDHKIFGPGSKMGQVNGRDPHLSLHRGAGAYICGEETALLEAIEGKRGWPRIKPPFPAVAGAFGRPTIINNVETLAYVGPILENGADWFKSLGKGRPEGASPQAPASFGTKLIGISGPVKRPGVYEENLGISVTEVIDRLGQGPRDGVKVKAYFHGGISMGVLSQDEAEAGATLDFDIGKKWNNLGLGTACLTVIPESYSMVSAARNVARFFSHESCGQCTHCREGSSWLYKMLSRIEEGDGTTGDLDMLLELSATMGSMPGHNICGLSDGCNWAIRTIVNKFFGEFEAVVSRSKAVSLAVMGTV